ncbi:hypothetical protein AHMF7605_11755 [Adhaeribacter arboris]|uniref:DUF4249 domain-containing protein n=1 Tax=Adhaeribacter arboris TaxID=2072846 RepID=A0A2T2YF47_9BACT|nr:hypothetical protein [Adhaeribacter arboris]PSR54146.1 hypothetical protein AHMF7605_11755 [Adhaeribacter arboris]
MRSTIYLLALLLLFACTPNASEELVQPRISINSNAVYDSVVYENRPLGITLEYRRIADTTFTDPITQEIVPGISYTVLVYDSLQIKSPWEGEVRLVSIKRPSSKPALNLSSKNAPDNVYFVRKDKTNPEWSYLFYYKRVPTGTYAPMVCRFVIGKYASDPDNRYANIANWDASTVNVLRRNGNTSIFHIINPYAE